MAGLGLLLRLCTTQPGEALSAADHAVEMGCSPGSSQRAPEDAKAHPLRAAWPIFRLSSPSISLPGMCVREQQPCPSPVSSCGLNLWPQIPLCLPASLRHKSHRVEVTFRGLEDFLLGDDQGQKLPISFQGHADSSGCERGSSKPIMVLNLDLS